MNKIIDPAIDEIRQIRHEISAEFNHDPKKLYSYYKKIEDKLRNSQYTFLDNGPKKVKSQPGRVGKLGSLPLS
jgi:hypothetical protein